MTLGSWFREYVYIPLGGNRVSRGRHIRNLLIVWTLTGIWHGAGWNFIIWGLYYGIWLIVEKYLIGGWLDRHRVTGRFYTAFVVIIGWMIFSLTDLGELGKYLLSMTGFYGGMGDVSVRLILSGYGAVLLAGTLGLIPAPGRVRDFIFRRFRILVFIIELALMVLCISSLIRDRYNPFLYFRF